MDRASKQTNQAFVCLFLILSGAIVFAPLSPTIQKPAASPAAPWHRAHCKATMEALRDARPSTEWPPVCPMPPDKRLPFERASMPMRNFFCLAERYEGARTLTWSASYIDNYRADVASGASGGTYGLHVIAALLSTLRSLPLSLNGAVALVMGTEIPWVEALLLNEGVNLVWTFEYSQINVTHPRMRAKTSQAIAVDVLEERFVPVDIIVSFSSLEHSGLGRYGDALNPDGDRDAVAQAWCMLRPGGLFVLGLPMTCENEGDTVFNAHRVYGFERLAYIASNFELLKFADSCSVHGVGRGNDQASFQPVVVLRKPHNLDVPPVQLVAGDFAVEELKRQKLKT